MHILYYLATFPELSESFILNEIAALTERGHTVSVFAREAPTTPIRHEEVADLDLEVRYAERPSIAIPTSLTTGLFDTNILSHLRAASDPLAFAKVLHYTGQCMAFVDDLDTEVDHVHTHFATYSRLPAPLVASTLDVPCSVTTHAYELYNAPNRRQLSHVLEAFDQIVTISAYNRQHIRSTLTSATPIEIVRAGIDIDKFEPSAETIDHRVLTVARFVEKKGITSAIDAIAAVRERIPTLEYHLIGSGPLESDIRSQIAQHDLDDVVTMPGHVSDARLIRELDEAACFLLPCKIAASGDRDGIPVSLMESMAMETPAVSTRVSGIPELIEDDVDGRLVDPGDVEAIANAVEGILSNADTREALGERARETVRDRFNIEREAAKLERIFRSSRQEATLHASSRS